MPPFPRRPHNNRQPRRSTHWRPHPGKPRCPDYQTAGAPDRPPHCPHPQAVRQGPPLQENGRTQALARNLRHNNTGTEGSRNRQQMWRGNGAPLDNGDEATPWFMRSATPRSGAHGWRSAGRRSAAARCWIWSDRRRCRSTCCTPTPRMGSGRSRAMWSCWRRRRRGPTGRCGLTGCCGC